MGILRARTGAIICCIALSLSLSHQPMHYIVLMHVRFTPSSLPVSIAPSTHLFLLFGIAIPRPTRLSFFKTGFSITPSLNSYPNSCYTSYCLPVLAPYRSVPSCSSRNVWSLLLLVLCVSVQLRFLHNVLTLKHPSQLSHACGHMKLDSPLIP